MPRPQLWIGSTQRVLRREMLQQHARDITCLPLVLLPGFAAIRGWRSVAQKYFSPCPALPHFAALDDWFAEAALASADTHLSFIKKAERRLVLRALLSSIKSQLTYVGRLIDTDQFLQQIDQWMALLFSAGIQSWQLGAGPWSADLQIILQEYQNWRDKHAGELWDLEFAPQIYAQFAEKYPTPLQHVVVENAVTLTPNQQQGLEKLAAQSETMTIMLAVPGISKNKKNWKDLESFTDGTLLSQTLQFWKRQNAEITIIEDDAKPANQDIPELKNLYAIAQSSRNFKIRAEHTPWHEVRKVATAIRTRSRDVQHAATHGVIVNNASDYAEILKSTFEDCGLPVQRISGSSLLSAPLVRKFVRLLKMPANRWEIGELADLFSGAIIRFTHDEHEINAQQLGEIASTFRQYRLNDFAQILRSPQQHSYLKRFDLPVLQKDIAALEELQRRVASVMAAETPQIWHEMVAQLWKNTTAHWEDLNEARHQDDIKLRRLDFKNALRNFEHSCHLWSQSYAGNSALWLGQLESILRDTNVSGSEGVTCGIEVTSPNQLLQNIPDVIYWMGMTESDYPKVTGGALQKRHRDAIKELCPHVPSPAEESSYWLALALAEAKEIHFSYPNFQNNSTASQSVLLTDIEGAQVKEQRENEQKGNTGSAPPEKYFSTSALLQQKGMHAEKSTFDDEFLAASWEMFQQRNGLELNLFDGSLGDDSAELVKQAFLAHGQPLRHSASTLQSYAECGLKYFFRKVLLLKDPTDETSPLDKREEGTLIHDILEEFYTRLKRPIAEESRQENWALLRAITDQKIDDLPLPSVLQKIERFYLIGDGGEGFNGLLGAYFEAEIKRRSGEEPSEFMQPMIPFSLGNVPLPPTLSAVYEGNFQQQMRDVIIDGKFDRLDVSEDGSAIVAIDYKTGRVPPTGTEPDGLHFQMPLYVWSLAELFKDANKKVGGIFYSLSEQKYQSGMAQESIVKIALNKDGTPSKKQNSYTLNAELWQNFGEMLYEQIREIHALIERGQFPLTVRKSQDANCKFCEFRNICFRNDNLQEQRQKVLRENSDIYTRGIEKKSS